MGFSAHLFSPTACIGNADSELDLISERNHQIEHWFNSDTGFSIGKHKLEAHDFCVAYVSRLMLRPNRP